MQHPKTNLTGIALLLTIAVSMAMVWAGKATLTEAGAFAGTIVGVVSGIGFFMAGDAQKPEN